MCEEGRHAGDLFDLRPRREPREPGEDACLAHAAYMSLSCAARLVERRFYCWSAAGCPPWRFPLIAGRGKDT